MIALRLALISTLAGGCATTQERIDVVQVVGPELGESTAMGPRDATREPEFSPSGVPEDVGPGLAISTPPAGAPTPTAEPDLPIAIAGDMPVYILPLEPAPPPPVFQPPPPPPPPDLSDQEG